MIAYDEECNQEFQDHNDGILPDISNRCKYNITLVHGIM